ncbi:hypothetical protein DPEC_G00242570 [Dallia pectoralis]|uniref:Uncharacterized protein n=1 Tax=Dallia pectoralis TaxID=75939 RepID=A0ACC2FV92_DALPE|nr:hypothetical protein DPEC_G00242570 [Dallia pectoralis]
MQSHSRPETNGIRQAGLTGQEQHNLRHRDQATMGGHQQSALVHPLSVPGRTCSSQHLQDNQQQGHLSRSHACLLSSHWD